MIFFILVYVTIYVINLSLLIYLIRKTFRNKITPTSLPYMLYYIVNFSKLKNTYYGLVIALTGLPPFILFFIKFNILLEVLLRAGYLVTYVIFLLLFSNMLFYLQPLYLKNINFNLEHLQLTKNKITFKELFIIHFFLSLFYLSVFFFPDIYIISTTLLL